MNNLQVSKNSIITLIAELKQTTLDPDSYSDDAEYINDFGMDSLTLVAFVFLCEKKFNINLAAKTEELFVLRTIGDTVKFLKKYIELGNGADQ